MSKETTVNPELQELHNNLRASAATRLEVQIADDVWFTHSGGRISIENLKKDHMRHIIRLLMRNLAILEAKSNMKALENIKAINRWHQAESERIRNAS